VSGLGSFLRAAYIQFAAVLGAISLISLLVSITEIELFGVVLKLVNWWAETARPIIVFFYTPILAFFGNLLNITFELPIVVQDYLAVGVALILSRLRGAFEGWRNTRNGEADTLPLAKSHKLEGRVLSSLLRKPLLAFSILLRTLFVWPYELLLMIRILFSAKTLFPEKSDEYVRHVRSSHAIALLPVLYCLVLVVINWILALFPTLRIPPSR